ncbi:hypothetical protein [Chitinophaga sp. GbtcB8]|uniref:hypothetical protein n=1 Tax=Chitinophaga sp. GbtcB8 TaxID=2824753 RepID=UPI001C30E743|nr:hypothetical protein [Chitinophaga sp. GbtcB8]
MKLYVNQSSTLGEIQKDFRDMYPYLKLEFYKRIQTGNQGASSKDKLQANYLPGKINTGRVYTAIDISPQRSAGELENEILDILGVSAQVFRRSGNIWIQTTDTDKWSLRLQNEEGRASCISISPGHQPPEQED